jgi:hypothetical protein
MYMLISAEEKASGCVCCSYNGIFRFRKDKLKRHASPTKTVKFLTPKQKLTPSLLAGVFLN